MNEINYDFSSIIHEFVEMKEGTITPSNLQTLKVELNRFFEDSTCKEVLYTTNNDKMFFGIKIIPMIDADDIYDLLIDDEQYRIKKYIVEIDSKLLDPILNLSELELTAILLREVNSMVGNSQPIENARNVLNIYLAFNKDHLKVSQSIHYKEILAFGLKDYLSKAQSMFYIDDEYDITTDEFMMSYGFINDLFYAYKKLYNSNIKLFENCNISKFIVFSWTLSIYKNLRIHRVGALNTLKDMKDLTGSRLEKLEIDNVIRRIQRIDGDTLLESSENSSISVKIKEKLKKARLNNLRSIDATFYELSMQVRNVEDENDALYLMRQINSNISIIEEYRNSKDIDKYEIDRWNVALDKFIQLRDKLSSSIVYKNKNFGIFVNYPDIVENRY